MDPRSQPGGAAITDDREPWPDRMPSSEHRPRPARGTSVLRSTAWLSGVGAARLRWSFPAGIRLLGRSGQSLRHYGGRFAGPSPRPRSFVSSIAHPGSGGRLVTRRVVVLDPVSQLLAYEQAIRTLHTEFPEVPDRVILDVFRVYYQQLGSITAAVEAARRRITDACATA